MKWSCAFALLFGILLTPFYRANSNSNSPTLNIRVLEISDPGWIRVEILNESVEPVNIFRESNSWGAGSWTLFKVNADKAEVWRQHGGGLFTRDLPTFDTILPGGSLVKKLNINSPEWKAPGGMPFKVKPGDALVLSYEVHPSVEGKKLGVWHGIIACAYSPQIENPEVATPSRPSAK